MGGAANMRRLAGHRPPRPEHDATAVGRRVFLRQPRLSDEAEYLTLRRISRALHQPWEPTPARGQNPHGPAAFAQLMRSASSETTRRFLVCTRTDGTLVGQVSLNGIMRGCFQNAILGYWVGSPFAGQGYMTEAIELICNHVFRDMRLHRLEANIQPANVASIRLIERCGFVFEGASPRYLKIRGRWRDHVRYVMLAECWASRRCQRSPK